MKPEELEMLKRNALGKCKAPSSAEGWKKQKAAKSQPTLPLKRTKVIPIGPPAHPPKQDAPTKGSRQAKKNSSIEAKASSLEGPGSSTVPASEDLGNRRVVKGLLEGMLLPLELERIEGQNFLSQQREAVASILRVSPPNPRLILLFHLFIPLFDIGSFLFS